jgi:hypothetical protein
MRAGQFTLNRQSVYSRTVELVVNSLGFADYKRTCPARMLVALATLAAARLTSLSQVCQGTLRSCSYETARKALLANLPDRTELEEKINEALCWNLPQVLRRKPQRMAIDITKIPYHGTHYNDPAEIVRGKSKSGTTHFHAYATLCVVVRGQRFTVAMTYVKAGEKSAQILQRLLARAAKKGVKPALLLLDREFWSVDVIRYLQRARCPFLMPVVARGNNEQHLAGPSGTRVFFTWKKSGFGSYQLRGRGRQAATVKICVWCGADKANSKKRRTLVYAYWGWEPASPAAVREIYRQRYGIESSYRQMYQAKARTCTRNPAVRLLLVGLSLLLRNMWVWLHYEILSTPRRGGRRFNPRRLYYQNLLWWLITAIERQLHAIHSIPIERHPHASTERKS